MCQMTKRCVPAAYPLPTVKNVNVKKHEVYGPGPTGVWQITRGQGVVFKVMTPATSILGPGGRLNAMGLDTEGGMVPGSQGINC